MTEALNDQDPEQQQDETQPDPLEDLRRERDSLQDRLLRTGSGANLPTIRRAR